MLTLYSNNEIDLYEYAFHYHNNESNENYINENQTLTPVNKIVEKNKSLTQEEILKDLMNQSNLVREVITVNPPNYKNNLKRKNVNIFKLYKYN